MTTLTCMRGYPGSGKSTEARAIAKSAKAATVIIGRDYIREMLFGPDYQQNSSAEDTVTVAQRSQITALLKADTDVIVDDCNVNAQYLKSFRDLARRAGAHFQVVDVPTDVETCIVRDFARYEQGGRHVGEAVIRKMAKRHPISKWSTVKPRQPIVVRPLQEGENSETLMPVYIVDIDGTLANHDGIRSPYDYTKVAEDTLHEDVAYLVNKLAENNGIIIMSGRDDTCRHDTAMWLAMNDITFDNLYMRPTAGVDERAKDPDWIVKLGLFNKHIRNQYHVRGVIDDRQQVVDLWRQLGLRCYQVAPGDF